MRISIAAAIGLAGAMIAGCASAAVPGFGQLLAGAGDIAWNCSVGRNKSPEQIISYCTQAISSTAWHSAAWAYFARALAYIRLDQSKSALDDLNAAVKTSSERDPNLPGIYFARAFVRIRLGQSESALDDLNAAITTSSERDPRLPDFYNERCYTRAKLGTDLQSALDDCNRSLALRPGDPSTLDSRALVEYRVGNFYAAITDCGTALQSRPNLASSLYVRGLAELKAGDAANGDRDISAANRLKPSLAAQFASFGVSQ